MVNYTRFNCIIDNRQDLLKKLDMLARMEITREELLEEVNAEVHTTTPTPSPIKAQPKKQSKKQQAGKKQDGRRARIAAGKKRAEGLFRQMPYTAETPETSSSEEDSTTSTIRALQMELEALKRKVKDGTTTTTTATTKGCCKFSLGLVIHMWADPSIGSLLIVHSCKNFDIIFILITEKKVIIV